MNVQPKILSLDALESEAVPRLPASIAGYYTGYSERGFSAKDNIAAFSRWRLLPRCMVDVSKVDTSTTLFGSKFAAPILAEPMAMQCMAHHEGEAAVARAAAAEGTGMVLSSMATMSAAEVGTAAPGAPLWYQLYVLKDRTVTERMVKRAAAAGFKALVVTVDAPRLGKRDVDDVHRFNIPQHLRLANLDDLADKVQDGSRYGTGSGFGAFFTSQIDPSLTWDFLTWLKTTTDLPIIVKGILAPDDARAAVQAGAAGIIVSNHGGRQLDSTPSGIDALGPVVRAVNGRVPVLVDGGVRRGTDVLKCLCLGAAAVLVGRPVLWGLSIDGEAGVKAVFRTLRTELEMSMALAGAPSLKHLGPQFVIPPVGGPLAIPPARL